MKNSEDSMVPSVSGGLYGVGPLPGRERLREAAGRGARRDMVGFKLSYEPRQAVQVEKQGTKDKRGRICRYIRMNFHKRSKHQVAQTQQPLFCCGERRLRREATQSSAAGLSSGRSGLRSEECVFQPLPSSLAAFRSAVHSTGDGFPGRTGFGVHLPPDECFIIGSWPWAISMINNGWIKWIGIGMCGRGAKSVSGRDMSRDGGSR